MTAGIAENNSAGFHPSGSPAGLASVVITCYNQAHFLATAIQSALEQTLQAAEVIVVDDGSTDQTASVARAFPQVRYLRQENRGLAAARNAGLARALGQYVCFLDADDLLLPRAIESGCAVFEEHPQCAFVYGDSRDIDSGGRVTSDPRGPRVASEHYRRLLEGNFIGMHATVLYRRDILRSAGGFDTRLDRCEDYELYLRLVRDFPVQEHSEIIACYRQHDLNMSLDHAAMLDAAVSAVRMQKTAIRSNPVLLDAARRGIANWRNYYGDLLLEDLRSAVKADGFSWTACRIFRSLLVRRPRQLTGRVLNVAKRRLTSSLSAVRKSIRGNRVSFGELRRVTPFSRRFGFDLGLPVDRYYIEQFLLHEAENIRGGVLEAGDDSYTRRFGGARVTRSDVLHVTPGTPGATIIADLTQAGRIPSNSFDCIILTQTLHFIFDLRAALRTIARILRPGGCLLLTTPGISQICRDQADPESDSWRLTVSSATKLFGEFFGERNIHVASHGNVLVAAAFLYGLPASQLTNTELNSNDPDYPLIVSVVARRENEGA
jgi:glycosyltransferase involved in cell wall biosynthesis